LIAVDNAKVLFTLLDRGESANGLFTSVIRVVVSTPDFHL